MSSKFNGYLPPIYNYRLVALNIVTKVQVSDTTADAQ